MRPGTFAVAAEFLCGTQAIAWLVFDWFSCGDFLL
jgi:hypothetical protein